MLELLIHVLRHIAVDHGPVVCCLRESLWWLWVIAKGYKFLYGSEL